MVSSPIISLLGMTFNIYGIILVVLLIVFALAFMSAQKHKGLDWTDMITHDGSDRRVSLTKILQLVGGVLGTWVVIQMTLGGSLTWDIFAIFLAYTASIEGFSKVVRAKYGSGESESRSPYRRSINSARRVAEEDEDEESVRPAASAKTPDID